MKISPEGKNYIEQVLADSGVKTLRFFGIAGCCGVNLGVGIEAPTEDDAVQTIEGIEVAIHPDIAPQLSDVTIHAEEENGELGLVLVGYSPKSC
ncbi:Fe-S cluster assembly protein HesB [Lysinibacillus sp. FJAT-14745]|uniref:Fe-S cluster assembly protein HesB n=1 Tax=Lysinibacillus sp. FJAT-14745 TaxID=1704289 RepID=UPI0006AB9600|nr:Fe-S cluster assembly protein HesB [Lysinibacillus sp. FJAT-14745]KOP70221.1 Fe-S cluster assembly protein HesB [Lysinibacillus sp. FJAT-14745]